MPARRSPIAQALVLVALAGQSPAALAGELVAALSRSAIREDMLAYYEAEKSATVTLMGFGAISLGAGAALSTRTDDLSRGLGGAFLALGALQELGGVTYLTQVDREIVSWSGALEKSPADFQRDESTHIRGTTRRFVFYRLTELTIFAGGVAGASYGFAERKDAWQGIGVGTALEGGLLLTIDSLNNARAQRYADQLRRLDVGLSVAPPAPDRPWAIGLAGRF